MPMRGQYLTTVLTSHAPGADHPVSDGGEVGQSGLASLLGDHRDGELHQDVWVVAGPVGQGSPAWEQFRLVTVTEIILPYTRAVFPSKAVVSDVLAMQAGV